MKPILLFIILCSLLPTANALPKGFVYLHDIAPEIIEDMRYASSYNFIGHPIPGYQASRCILTREAAGQLAKAEKAAQKKGYTFKVYDCYRPQTAVNAFYKWSQSANDIKMKKGFYPREDKRTLFAKGYIAQSSGHTRGSTIDLTLVKIGTKDSSLQPVLTRCYGKTISYMNDNSLNTGTRFDCMDRAAHVTYKNLSIEQKTNRLLLRNLMINYGFTPYSKEWWHFTLKHEPYPHTYFDFPVR